MYQCVFLFSSHQVLPNAHAHGLQPVRLRSVQYAVPAGVSPEPRTGSVPGAPAAIVPLPSAPAADLLPAAVTRQPGRSTGSVQGEGNSSPAVSALKSVLWSQPRALVCGAQCTASVCGCELKLCPVPRLTARSEVLLSQCKHYNRYNRIWDKLHFSSSELKNEKLNPQVKRLKWLYFCLHETSGRDVRYLQWGFKCWYARKLRSLSLLVYQFGLISIILFCIIKAL